MSGDTITCRLRDARVRGLSQAEFDRFRKKGIGLNQPVTVPVASLPKMAGKAEKTKPRKVAGGEA